MFRTVLKTVAPRAVASGRLPATVAARRSILILGPPCQGVAPLAFDLVASTRCQWRNMSSASATSANNVNVSTAGGDAAQEEGGGEGGAGGEWDGRDPKTGEGIWVDDEDEPLVLEKPKKVQKFCGKVISDNMDKTIKVAVPYWYFVKGLGRKTIRYSKIMAHDEENSCSMGDTVVLVDCQKKSKRKKHTLHRIVRKLPTL